MPQYTEATERHLKWVSSLEDIRKLSVESQKELFKEEQLKHLDYLLVSAANCQHCTFVIDKELVNETPVPSYSTLRRFSYFLNAYGWYLADKGNYEKAAETFIHLFRFGTNLSNDRLILSLGAGSTFQEMALSSIEKLLELPDNKKFRKIINDYFKTLPKPATDYRKVMRNEQRYIENIFESLELLPGLLVDAYIFKEDDYKKKKTSVSVKSSDMSCVLNQRVLTGAVEMYLMDHEDFVLEKDSDFIKKLVEEKYLKVRPVCENKGVYSAVLSPDGDAVIRCSCGVTQHQIEEKIEKEDSRFSPELSKAIDKYIKSKTFAKEKKELMEFYKEQNQLDIYSAADDAKVEKFIRRVKESKNKLVNNLVFNSEGLIKRLRSIQKRVDKLAAL